MSTKGDSQASLTPPCGCARGWGRVLFSSHRLSLATGAMSRSLLHFDDFVELMPLDFDESERLSLRFLSLASSDGAPWSSQFLNSFMEWARLHSSKMALAMANVAPAESDALHSRPQRSSHSSNASGLGSSSTARWSNSRLIARPMASGVWSRLRFRLRPSAASSAASKAPQTFAGRIIEWLMFSKTGCARSNSAYCQL
jgi:hypothetical protein